MSLRTKLYVDIAIFLLCERCVIFDIALAEDIYNIVITSNPHENSLHSRSRIIEYR